MKTLIVTAALLAAAMPARAQASRADQIYHYGQYAGALKFCEIPTPEILIWINKLLVNQKLNIDSPSPDYNTYIQGMADGVVEMRDHAPVTCDKMRESFVELKSQL